MTHMHPELAALVAQYGGPPPPNAVPPHLHAVAAAYVARLRRPRIESDRRVIETRAALKEAAREKEAVAARKAAGHYVPPAETVDPKPTPTLPGDLASASKPRAPKSVDEVLAELRKPKEGQG